LTNYEVDDYFTHDMCLLKYAVNGPLGLSIRYLDKPKFSEVNDMIDDEDYDPRSKKRTRLKKGKPDIKVSDAVFKRFRLDPTERYYIQKWNPPCNRNHGIGDVIHNYFGDGNPIRINNQLLINSEHPKSYIFTAIGEIN